MKFAAEITEADLKNLIIAHFRKVIEFEVKLADINIEVKSAQNYKSEWEHAAFRARVEVSRPIEE